MYLDKALVQFIPDIISERSDILCFNLHVAASPSHPRLQILSIHKMVHKVQLEPRSFIQNDSFQRGECQLSSKFILVFLAPTRAQGIPPFRPITQPLAQKKLVCSNIFANPPSPSESLNFESYIE